MSRDASGNFTLASGNPVVTGTTITSTWANNTLSDIATEMTDSLNRSGKGPMLAALKAVAGSISAPGYTWGDETTMGFYRASAGNMRATVSSTDVLTFTASAVTASPSTAARGR
jgi:hypothetical protein